ncbi:MAG: DNA-binding protein WhiA [Clostridia bacterium]|nr:DNA-binding protein WhiA [Clostridia bacterium]
MSFSSDIKDEIYERTLKNGFTDSLLYAAVLFGRSFGTTDMSLLTESESAMLVYSRAIKRFGGRDAAVVKSDSGKYRVSAPDRAAAAAVISALGYGGYVKRRINFGEHLENKDDLAAFLSGVFMSCGTAASPEKDYHIEFTVPGAYLYRDLLHLFEELNDVFQQETIDSPDEEKTAFRPKVQTRDSGAVVYLKSFSDVRDALGVMGAVGCSLRLLETEIVKNARNDANRTANCEQANMRRTALASVRQYDAVCRIRDSVGLDSLPEDLKEIALLRLENREMSLSEMVETLDGKYTRSALNYRLGKLIAMSGGR